MPSIALALSLAFGLASTGTQSFAQGNARTDGAGDGVRPFQVQVPEEALVDLRKRVQATRWPDKETVEDQSQGVPQARLQEPVRYWGTSYDWRKVEARLNALPQFT